MSDRSQDPRFQRLPSAIQMEAFGSTNETIRKMARGERRGLQRQAYVEQVFSRLWDRLEGDEDNRDLAWAFFRMGQSMGAIDDRGRLKATPEEAMEFLVEWNEAAIRAISEEDEDGDEA